MKRLECSVWSNGDAGWGLKVLGGSDVRRANFKPPTVVLVLDGREVSVNTAKRSFWNERCGELIKKEIGAYIERHGLKTGDRVFLRAIEPGAKYAVDQA